MKRTSAEATSTQAVLPVSRLAGSAATAGLSAPQRPSTSSAAAKRRATIIAVTRIETPPFNSWLTRVAEAAPYCAKRAADTIQQCAVRVLSVGWRGQGIDLSPARRQVLGKARAARRRGAGKTAGPAREITKQSQFIIEYQSLNFRESQSSKP